MQTNLVEVATLREMGAEMRVWGQEQEENSTLCLLIVLIFESHKYITNSKKCLLKIKN